MSGLFNYSTCLTLHYSVQTFTFLKKGDVRSGTPHGRRGVKELLPEFDVSTPELCGGAGALKTWDFGHPQRKKNRRWKDRVTWLAI
jgi:hypothetical protein